jgi:hypothetical protein
MKTYFLSYARLDERAALRFADDLIAAGVSVWVDQYDIRPSQHWDRAVETAVRGCQGMIVILSPRSAASPNVADEVAVAIEDGKDLIPILIETCTVPLRMTRMQFIDATRGHEGALQRVLQVIQAEAAPASAHQYEMHQLEQDVLRKAQRRLTGFMGPIAGVLVRRAAATAASEADLYHALAKSIPNPLEQETFLGWLAEPKGAAGIVTPRATRGPEGPPAAPVELEPSELEAITKALTRQLGPIAAQLVKREAPGSASRRDLVQRLAARIAADADRAAFLKDTRN